MTQTYTPNINFINPIPVKQIVANHILYIPYYQRGYKWGKTEIEQFLSDVYTKMTEEDAALKPMFLAVIAMCNVEGQKIDTAIPMIQHKDIIDGQQRLTSISLTLAAIAREVGTLKLDEKSSTKRGKFTSMIDDFLFANPDDMEKGSAITRLIHGDSIERLVYADLCYHESSVPDYKQDLAAHALRSCNIYVAYNIINRWIKQLSREVGNNHQEQFHFLQTFAKMLMHGVYASVVESQDSGTVIEFFQNMNTKGLKLSQMEQVKTLFAQRIEVEQFKQLWEVFNDHCRTMCEGVYKLKDDEVLRLWLFTETKKVVQKAGLYKTALHYLDSDQIAFDEESMHSLNNVAERLARYSQHRTKHQQSSDALFRISLLSGGRSRQHIPVMLAASHLENNDPQAYETLLHEIEKTIFVTITAHPSTGLYKQRWPEWASKAFNLYSGDDLTNYLETTLWQACREAEPKFKQAFAVLGNENSWRNDRPQISADQRYALLVFAQKTEEAMGNPIPAAVLQDRITAEHILPARRDMAQYHGLTIDAYRQNIAGIGNLLPLSETENSVASDRPLIDAQEGANSKKTKMRIYTESTFAFTSITASGHPALAHGKAKGAAFLNKIPVLDQNFTPDSILARGEALADLASAIWIS